MTFRTEIDFLGKLDIPGDALYGIHALRAKQNFPGSGSFPMSWYKALGLVKLAYYKSIEAFSDALQQEYEGRDWAFRLPDKKVIIALQTAANEVAEGEFFEFFIVPALQGGAGTSINMNINEILANRALQILGFEPGQYSEIDPVEDANLFQSTNDTIPSALRLAAMTRLEQLEGTINRLRKQFEIKEREYGDIIRIGYTQYQEAVPGSYGKLFSAYCDALSRDWWRISKGKERIKSINLGGSAIGTGLTVPRYIIMSVTERLRDLSKLPLAKAENLSDATSNQDDLVELHGLLCALAVNLEKIAGDIRLLGADISSVPGFKIPARQAGSSVMPGKINPVIPEFVISTCQQVYSNDLQITRLAAMGSLDLNPFLPQIGSALLNSIDILINAAESFTKNCVSEIVIEKETSEIHVSLSPSIATALIPFIGYHKAAKIALYMNENKCTLQQANEKYGFLHKKDLNKILKTENLLKTGFSVRDLEE